MNPLFYNSTISEEYVSTIFKKNTTIGNRKIRKLFIFGLDLFYCSGVFMVSLCMFFFKPLKYRLAIMDNIFFYKNIAYN
jgi:hypothetical protein